MKTQQWKQEEQLTQPNFTEESRITDSEYYEDYRAIMNVIPVDPISSVKLFKKHGIQYNSQGPFHNFSYKIVQSYLRHQIITININLAYFTLSLNVINDSRQNPFARITPNEDGKYGSLYFYPAGSCCLAIKSFDYTQEEFNSILERTLLEWSVLKICSALQCAPQPEHYFGFDLIIYEDCIQMAMEKCVILKGMSLKWLEPLKQELEIMHSFNIIHADIKPDNIVFSPSLNKPVFIDFGFSTIIKETPGQKKKSLFKGSPGFCSPEMLNLLSVNNLSEYIDLYYNDLHGLKISFKDCADNQLLPQGHNDGVVHDLKMHFPQVELKQPTRMYFHYRFKYYYISENIAQLFSLLENKELVKAQVAILIKFMRDIFQQFFHFEVLQRLKDYCFTHQYKLLMRQLSLQKSKIRLYIKQETINEGDHQQTKDFSSRFSHFLLKNQDFEIVNNLNFKAYSQFLLLGGSQTISKERCLDLLLHCLRFNIRNISFKVKIQIAAKWKQILAKESCQPCKEKSIEDIKYIFYYLLNYCTQQPLTQWKKNFYFEILFHSILLGIDTLENFKCYLTLMSEGRSNLIDRLILKADFYELEDRLGDLNLAAEANAPALTFICKLSKEIKKVELEVTNVNAADYDQEVQIILRLEDEFNKCKRINQQYQHFMQVRQIVKQVKNKRFNHYFSSIIFQKRLQYHVQRHPTNESLQLIREMMKEENILQNMNIHILFQINELFMLKLELGQQFKRMTNEIKEIIGCSCLVEKFKMDKYVFMVDSRNRDIRLATKYLAELDKSYIQLQILDIGVKRHLYYLLGKLQSAHTSDPRLKDLLISLYYKFRQTKDHFLQLSHHRIIDFQEILLKLDIEKQFISLLPELLPDFEDKLARMKEQLQVMYKSITMRDGSNMVITQDMNRVYQFVELRYEYFQSQDYYNLLLGNKKVQLRYLLDLANLSAILGLHTIYDHQCYRIIVLSNYLQEETIFSQFLQKQYELAETNQSPIHYLLHSKHFLLIYTLRYFHSIGCQDKTIALISMINHWINENPLQSYLRSYIESLEKFYRKVPTFFQYKTLRHSFSCGKGSKPYVCVLLVFCALAAEQETEKIRVLRAICLMLSKLTTYAREQILQRFHLVFALLKSISHSKIEIYLLRHNKPAFKSKPFSSILTKRLKNRCGNCPKRAALKVYLSKLL